MPHLIPRKTTSLLALAACFAAGVHSPLRAVSPITFSGNIDGSGILIVDTNSVSWSNLFWNTPTSVLINGVAWNPATQPTLSLQGPLLPADLSNDFLTTTVTAGRDIAVADILAGKVIIHFADTPDGSDFYNLSVGFSPKPPPANQITGSLHVVATIDGSDILRITNAGATWIHSQWANPSSVSLNGVAWDTVASPSIPNSGPTSFLPPSVDLSTLRFTKTTGRDTASYQVFSDHIDVSFGDNPIGAATYDVTLGFGPTPPATPATWVGTTSGLWSTAARWSPAVVPNNGTPADTTYDVVINATGSNYNVTVTAPVVVDNLSVVGVNGGLNATLVVQSTGGVPKLTVLGTLLLDHTSMVVSDITSFSGTFIRDNATVSFAGQLSNLAAPLDLGTTVLGRVDIAGNASLSNLTLTNSLGSIIARSPGVAGPVTLNSVTLDADLDLDNNVNLAGSLVLDNSTVNLRFLVRVTANPASLITGTGNIQFAAGGSSGGTISLTNGTITPGVAIRTLNGGGTVILSAATLLQGLISAEAAGKTLTLTQDFTNSGTLQAMTGGILSIGATTPGSVTNAGLIQASGGSVIFNSSIANNALVSALNAGTLTIANAFSNTGTLSITNSTLITNALSFGGTFIRSNATVAFSGQLSNLASPFDLATTPIGPVVIAAGASFNNLALTSSLSSITAIGNSSATFATLNNVTLDTALNTQLGLQLAGSLTMNNATINILSNAITISANSSAVITGTGSFQFTNNIATPGSTLTLSAGTITPGIAIRTVNSGGNVAFSGNTLFQGLISAEAAGRTLTLTQDFTNSGTIQAMTGALLRIGAAVPGSVTNAGLIQASGGSLIFNSSIANNALVSALNAGTLTIANAFSNSGTLSITNSTLLTNALAIGGTFLRSNATVAFSGQLSNLAAPFDLGTTPLGQVDLAAGASLSNLTLFSSLGPVALIPNPPATSATFNNLTLSTDLNLRTQILLSGSLTLDNATVNFLSSASNITASQPAVITGNGSLIFSSPSGNAGSLVLGSGTITSGVAIRSMSTDATITLTNGTLQGLVSAEGPRANGTTLAVRSSFSSSGTLQALSGSKLLLGNSTAGMISNTGLIQAIGGTVTAAGTISNFGTILAMNGGVFSGSGSLVNSGVISATSNGSIILPASFSSSGTLSIDGGNLLVPSLTPGIGGTLLLHNASTFFTGTISSVDTDFGVDPVYGHFGLAGGALLSNLRFSSSAGPVVASQISGGPPAKFSNVTLSADLDFESGETDFSGSLTLDNSTIRFQGSGTAFFGGANSVLTGTGTLLFDGGSPSSLALFGPSFFGGTVTPGVAIRTASSSGLLGGVVGGINGIVFPQVSTVYEGLISAETPGVTLTIGPNFTNSGMMQVIQGSNLIIGLGALGYMDNEGVISASGGGLATISGALPFTSNGTITADGGTVLFAAQTASTVTLAGVIQAMNGGTLNYQGGHLAVSGPIHVDGSSSLIVSNIGSTNNVALSSVIGGGAFTTSNGAVVVGDMKVGAVTIQNNLLSIRAGSSYSKMNTLSIGHSGAGAGAVYGAGLQLNDNRVVLQTTDANDKAAKILSLNEAIFAGHGGTNNVWSVTSGITSATVAADPQHLTLGVYDNAALHSLTNSSLPRTDWAGGTGNVDTNSLLITLALKGDANLDGVIDIADMVVIANNWNASGVVNGISTIDMAHGDVNQDGIVDIADMVVIANNWNQTSSLSLLPEIAQSTGVSLGDLPITVPEPHSLALLLLSSPLLWRRRSSRRKRFV